MTFITFAGGAGFIHGRVFHGGSIGDLVMCDGSGAQVAEQTGMRSGHVF